MRTLCLLFGLALTLSISSQAAGQQLSSSSGHSCSPCIVVNPCCEVAQHSVQQCRAGRFRQRATRRSETCSTCSSCSTNSAVVHGHYNSTHYYTTQQYSSLGLQSSRRVICYEPCYSNCLDNGESQAACAKKCCIEVLE